ncbi:MAG TPA: methionine--tRNA ligase [Acholeplasmataceae bacterium]|jgi:methionyl-tRNA synthetase|nr:methionine--tRNA ligase [Acholeplasmataceae bacterium]
MKKKYYITTAIPYSSAIPHIGNIYEIILTDAIARFKRLEGYDVYFQTGTDEHGQKISQNAKNNGVDPQTYVDLISGEIKKIFDLVDISYDSFVRTTDARHVHSVQQIFEKLLAQGDIYLGQYEGWYSISEEAFISEKDLVDGKTPNGDVPIWMSEEAYFLKLSKYQKQLVDHINKNPNFILPESRKNEMVKNFLEEPLLDISITRTAFDWGIPTLTDPKHVAYVWIDALCNYITGLDYSPEKEPGELFKKYWPADLHVVGKDVMRFHVIFWPILLLALGIELPKTIFGHPWVLFNRNKMSKSTGNVMYTNELVKYFGVDPVRYYCLHEIPYNQDGNMTYELIIERNNSDLANTVGNLVNRTLGMIKKYRGGEITRVILDDENSKELRKEALEALPKMVELMDELKVGDALEVVIALARSANKYIDLMEPWKLNKDESKQKELDNLLYHLIETIRFISVLLNPFIPQTSVKIANQINYNDITFESLKEFGVYPSGRPNEAEVLFERFDLDKKIEEILSDKNEKK